MLSIRRIHHALSRSAREAGWSLALALAACVAAALVALAINVLWVSRSEAQLVHIVETRDRIDQLRLLDQLLSQAESAQRGYLILGDSRYATPYNDRVDLLRQQLSELQQGIARNAEVEARLGEPVRRLAMTISEKIAEMDVTLKFANAGDFVQAREVFRTNVGLQKTMKISSIVTGLVQFETQYLVEQRKGRDKLLFALRSSMAVTTLLVLLCVVLMLKRLLGDVMRAQTEREALRQRERELDALVRQRTDEMERLAVQYQLDVERERHRLARELHDELGAILTATKIDLHWVLRQLHDQYPMISDKLAKTQRNLDQAIQFKRRLVQELHPSLLSTFGLLAAIRTLAEEAAGRGEWQLTLNLPEDGAQINEVQGLIIYRIVQETLHNAVKYAEANSVSISLIVDVEFLKLEVADDGVGMDPNRVTPNHYGITGMRHRVTAIGGRINIVSAPGEGVMVCALIPRRIEAAPPGTPERRYD
ncbi:CHASE3 domain-containing protein [Chitinolyticbacter meiyuanensis]|uniref:CHASE3 domain-containing protein n=1 Tax=Chitinolyticbacter meiyuanensis TaxID=682798 RepID=UPI0011E5FFDC|nr:CHASE3 domain-containing protein [Chitinolyticbacter meiyuanensis]